MFRYFVCLLFVLPFFNFTAFAQSSEREAQLKEIESLRSQLKVREAEFLAPSAEDYSKFVEFLRESNTGLIRLLPREKYDGKNGKLTIRGGGAYYSFARLTHEYGYGSDISLEMNYLKVGFAGADYGMLVNLGDVALDEVTLESPIIQILAKQVTPDNEPQAREMQRKVRDGFLDNEVSYKNHLPAIVNNTYVVRSVNYGDSDLLAVFRVVRKDADGSLILAWKLLKTFPKPELKREAASAAESL